MTNQYIALAGGVMSFIGLIIILAQLGQPTIFAYQGMILGAVFLGLGVVVIAISAIVSDNKKSLYFCKHCKFAAAELADLYNHSVKEHDDDNVEGIEKELKDELDGYEKYVKSLPYDVLDQNSKEVEKLKTRNPYKVKGVIIGIITAFLVMVLIGNLHMVSVMDGDKMSPLIEDNDLMYRLDTPISEIDYNDIIFYTSSDKTMVNKVVDIISDEHVDYIFTVKNTASPDIRKVTEEQYLGKMGFVIGNVGEEGDVNILRIIIGSVYVILPIIGFVVPIIVMRHRAKINVKNKQSKL